MLGNVAEWVLDQYQADYYTALADKSLDPVRKPETKHPRTVKGGAYNDEAKDLRSANRLMSEWYGIAGIRRYQKANGGMQTLHSLDSG